MTRGNDTCETESPVLPVMVKHASSKENEAKAGSSELSPIAASHTNKSSLPREANVIAEERWASPPSSSLSDSSTPAFSSGSYRYTPPCADQREASNNARAISPTNGSEPGEASPEDIVEHRQKRLKQADYHLSSHDSKEPASTQGGKNSDIMSHQRGEENYETRTPSPREIPNLLIPSQRAGREIGQNRVFYTHEDYAGHERSIRGSYYPTPPETSELHTPRYRLARSDAQGYHTRTPQGVHETYHYLEPDAVGEHRVTHRELSPKTPCPRWYSKLVTSTPGSAPSNANLVTPSASSQARQSQAIAVSNGSAVYEEVTPTARPRKQKQEQRTKKRKKMYSDFVGVTYNKTHAKYQACITHYRKQHYLGRYKLAVDAARAYDESAKLLKGKGWKINFATEEDYEKAKKEEEERYAYAAIEAAQQVKQVVTPNLQHKRQVQRTTLQRAVSLVSHDGSTESAFNEALSRENKENTTPSYNADVDQFSAEADQSSHERPRLVSSDLQEAASALMTLTGAM